VVASGRIAVTPLQFERTNEIAFAELKFDAGQSP
jgi:hypothetical protein